MKTFEIIILAAGKSTRFGKNKLLELLDGEPMIRRVVREALSTKSKTMVVVGFNSDAIEKALYGLDANFIKNENYDMGMSSSIKVGVGQSSSKAILILPGDIAFIKREQIEAVMNEYIRVGAKIIVPTYKGRGGHPILFDSSLKKDLLAINEEKRGLKEIVEKYNGDIDKIELNTARILVDIDYARDLIERRKEIFD